MHLSCRIAESGLSNAVAQTFADGLKQVARADGPETEVERQLIDRLVDVLWTSDTEPAPFEALWSCAELFLTACVYVAVADSVYAIEEARRISLFSHRLGYSARRLSELESQVFRELRHRGAQENQRETMLRPDSTYPSSPNMDSAAWLRVEGAEDAAAHSVEQDNDKDTTEPRGRPLST
jgi:tellurite resistance protein